MRRKALSRKVEFCCVKRVGDRGYDGENGGKQR